MYHRTACMAFIFNYDQIYCQALRLKKNIFTFVRLK